MRSRLATIGILAATLTAQSASAISVGTAAFTSARVVESFEGIGVGANVGASAFANIFLPGVSGPYTFSTGIVLNGTNPGLFQNGAFLHETALGGASNNWGANGSVSNAGQVPDPWGAPSSAYLGAFDSLGTGSALIDISFTQDMTRVGAFVAGAAGSTVTLEAYDALGALLETMTIASPSVSAWASSFIGLERSEGIRRIVFRGADFGIDGLAFESAPVTEPSFALLAGGGVLGLWLMGRPRVRAIALARRR